MLMRLFFIALFAVRCLHGFSQDIILLKNTNTISAKIISVEKDTIKYKKYNDASGKIIAIAKNQVHMIQYENGEKEYFTSTVAETKTKKDEESEKKEKKTGETPSSEFRKSYLEIIGQPQWVGGGDFNVPLQPSNQNTAFVPMNKKIGDNIWFQAGADFGHRFSKNMGISLGVLYSQQGLLYQTYNTFKRWNTLSYLKLPLQFHFNTNAEKPIVFSCFAGFYFGLLLYYQDYYDGSSLYYNVTSYATGTILNRDGGKYTLTDKPFKNIDWGTTVGTGVQIKLSKKVSIPVMLNYQIGFADIKNRVSKYSYSGKQDYYWSFFSGYSNTESYYNRLLGLRTGLKINL